MGVARQEAPTKSFLVKRANESDGSAGASPYQAPQTRDYSPSVRNGTAGNPAPL